MASKEEIDRECVVIAERSSRRRRWRISREDAFQEAALEILRGAARYVPGKGKLSSFLSKWARYGVRRLGRQAQSEFKLTKRGHSDAAKFFKGKAEMGQSSDEGVIRRAGLNSVEGRAAVAAVTATRQDVYQAELMARPGEDPQEAMIRQERDQLLRSAINQLGDIQREIVTLHYGLDGEPMSYAQIGQRFGLTSQAVAERMLAARANLRQSLSGMED